MDGCAMNENCPNNLELGVQVGDGAGKFVASSPQIYPQKRKSVPTSASRVLRMSARKLRKVDEETETTVSLEEIPELSGLKVIDLNNRIKKLFPDPRVLALPCTSARLFACLSLVSISNEPSSAEDTPRRSSRQKKSQSALEPILPFLQALVQVEMTSLEVDGAETVPRERPRRIAFSGFDCSSTKPPVDRVDGSGQHQSNSIVALSRAKDILEDLIMDKISHSRVVHCLERAIDFLSVTLVNDETLQNVCAASISKVYPIDRLHKPMKLYVAEFQGIIRRLRGESSPSLFVERHLYELLCRSIRYHLRLLLNPPPPRLSPLDENYETRSKSFSQVHEMVEMYIVDQKRKEFVIENDRISSLVNEALKVVCHFFGSNNLLDSTYAIPTIDANFCESEAAQRQIPTRSSKVQLAPLSPEQVQDVEDDIHDAFSVLVTYNATTFLLQLLSITKVKSEIRRLGGWGDVETFATLLWRYELWESQEDYEHFVLLSNYNNLFDRLVSIKAALGTAGEAARVSLQDLGDRFRVNTKKNKAVLVRNYPEIKTVDEALEDGWKAANLFPVVREK